MLVLTRRHQERIQIGDQITLTVVKIKGNTVRLGIEAPRHIRVVRAELPRTADASATEDASASAPASPESCLSEVADGPLPESQFSETGDEAGQRGRLHGLVARVRRASAIAHAV